ncbi:DUF4147 domain-containing protein [Mesorhizobium sp. CA8]|uniref:glycerate kinase type-2 family protein n=1 Tax=unclassified Mesorhizobium TaxID=325217 RepID=UPI001CCB4E35|nr:MULTISPECIES: DUF4147 domain-containing protein [unclassified Mesorhizobium]MBZ9765129.1 DUF4147 domain-containing protein [Mesorhizobium sp. CA8]MBZ9823472.1 DUF4147 domain-containing protein [Mesorhizobium sp. CA4]
MLPGPASELMDLRKQAIDLFRTGIAAAEPGLQVAAALEKRADRFERAGRVILIAFGKAACAMTSAALPLIGSKLHKAIAVTNAENAVAIGGVEVIVAGHPLPDQESLKAGCVVETLARSAGPGDLVLVLVSGGGSALLCAPAAGLSLAEKIALNDALIRSGADIREINTVRQYFSRLKGGRLAQLASRADILALIVSDVPGDDVRLVASGPTASPYASAARALDVLSTYSVSSRFKEALIPTDVCISETMCDRVENVVVVSNRISLERLTAKALQCGIRVLKASDWLSGNVGNAARELHGLALEHACHQGPLAIVAGGEPTVEVSGTGKGGRNQELALRFALANEAKAIHRRWVFLSGGTDGRDGPTDAAGGIVDAGSISWMRDFGEDPDILLRNNDSYAALATSGDLLMTGATGTNVADLQILLMR